MAAEKNFENKIKRFLDSKGVWYVKYFSNGFTRRGVPDLLCCVNGFFVAIEVKADGGKLSDFQMLEIDKINKAGGIAGVIYPHHFERFKELIEKLLEVDK